MNTPNERISEKAELDRYKALSVGEILKRARLQMNMEIEPVGAQLNIRPELLEALEANDYDRLPGKVYVVGFVRTYAEALGLDGDKVAYLLKSQTVGHDYKELPNMPKPFSEQRMPSLWIILGSIAIIIIILIMVDVFSPDTTPPPITPPESMQR